MLVAAIKIIIAVIYLSNTILIFSSVFLESAIGANFTLGIEWALWPPCIYQWSLKINWIRSDCSDGFGRSSMKLYEYVSATLYDLYLYEWSRSGSLMMAMCIAPQASRPFLIRAYESEAYNEPANMPLVRVIVVAVVCWIYFQRFPTSMELTLTEKAAPLRHFSIYFFSLDTNVYRAAVATSEYICGRRAKSLMIHVWPKIAVVLIDRQTRHRWYVLRSARIVSMCPHR